MQSSLELQETMLPVTKIPGWVDWHWQEAFLAGDSPGRTGPKRSQEHFHVAESEGK